MALCVSLSIVATMQGAAQEACMLDAQEARQQTQVIEWQFTDPNPQWRRRLGLPDTIQSVAWPQDPALCAEALRQLRKVGDSLGWHEHPLGATTQVLVFLVEPGLYVVIGNGDLNATSFFDRRWRHLLTGVRMS
jgi:hypothetical protein